MVLNVYKADRLVLKYLLGTLINRGPPFLII